MDLKKLLLPAVGLLLAAILVALTAGVAYGAMAGLVGLVVLGGLTVGYGVAKADDDVPFADDGGATPLGDTPEHSDVSSALPTPPR